LVVEIRVRLKFINIDPIEQNEAQVNKRVTDEKALPINERRSQSPLKLSHHHVALREISMANLMMPFA